MPSPCNVTHLGKKHASLFKLFIGTIAMSARRLLVSRTFPLSFSVDYYFIRKLFASFPPALPSPFLSSSFILSRDKVVQYSLLVTTTHWGFSSGSLN